MKNRTLNVASLVVLGMVSACDLPPKVYYNRGNPENLLDVSSEIVNLPLASADSFNELAEMLNENLPTRAMFNCPSDDPNCAKAKELLDKHDIPSQWVATQTNAEPSVNLVYERVTARDCQNRYIDDTGTPGNLPPPTFGCSITGNMVQQVSDKRQFVSPNLLDFEDGPKAAQGYEHYMRPTPPAPPPPPYFLPPPTNPMAIYPSAVHDDGK